MGVKAQQGEGKAAYRNDCGNAGVLRCHRPVGKYHNVYCWILVESIISFTKEFGSGINKHLLQKIDIFS